MASKQQFPVKMHHPKTGGVTVAGGAGSLRVLESRGWKQGPVPETKKPAGSGS